MRVKCTDTFAGAWPEEDIVRRRTGWSLWILICVGDWITYAYVLWWRTSAMNPIKRMVIFHYWVCEYSVGFHGYVIVDYLLKYISGFNKLLKDAADDKPANVFWFISWNNRVIIFADKGIRVVNHWAITVVSVRIGSFKKYPLILWGWKIRESMCTDKTLWKGRGGQACYH